MGISISIPLGGRAPRVTIYHRSGGCCSGIFGLVFIIAATIFCVKSCGPSTSTTPDQPPHKPAAEKITPTKEPPPISAAGKITATNNPQPKTAAEAFLATNEPARKLKQSIDEAKLTLSANPAPIIEGATRAIVEEKTTYKSLIFKNLEFRKHAEGRLLIQHFTLDGKPYRIGFIERTPGDFADIDPNKLKSYISASTPEP